MSQWIDILDSENHTYDNTTSGLTATDTKAAIDEIVDESYTHPNHSGDVTSVGDGATTITNNAVTLAKLDDIATNSFLGRDTAGTGDPEVLSASEARAVLNVEDGATIDQTASEILTELKTVDGSGSGLDSDTVDALHGSQFLRSDADDTITGSVGQKISVLNSSYGIGIQTSVLYLRTYSDFYVFRGGTHSDTTGSPGAGGSVGFSIDTYFTRGMSNKYQIANNGSAIFGRTDNYPSYTFEINNDTDTTALVVDRAGTSTTNSIAEFRSNVTSTDTVHCKILGDGDLENTNNSYGAISDVKLKENIVDARDKLDDILSIKVRNYNFKDNPDFTQIGMVAQELEEVFPKLVKEVPEYAEVPDPDWVPGTKEVIKKVVKQKKKNNIHKEKGKFVNKVTIEEVEEEEVEQHLLYDEKGAAIGVHNVSVKETVQETEEDRPKIYAETGSTTKSIKYSVLVPILIKAIQELNAKVEALSP